jgi:hypothetical protein
MANDPTLIFLDANVLAKPVTRTLLLVGADPSGLAVTWSAHVEAEADRHVRGSALPVSGLRKRLDRVLGPTGTSPLPAHRRQVPHFAEPSLADAA